jgi:carboxypeptidase Q
MQPKTMLIAAAVLAVGASRPAFAQLQQSGHADLPDTASRVRDRALSGSGVYDLLESLTTEVGPRLAGSPAMGQRAKDWAIAKMTSLGFKNVHAEPFPIFAWFNGVETAEITAPFTASDDYRSRHVRGHAAGGH